MAAVTKREAESPNRPSKKPRSEVQQTLYLKNVNDKVNRTVLKHTLYLLFSTHGEILDVNMKMRGQAHVVFDSEEAASRALRALQETDVFGKKIRIDYAKNKSACIEAAEKAIAEED